MNTKFIEDALGHDDATICKTPYWFIVLLIKINDDSMGYVITLLYEDYKTTNSIVSAINLLIGIYQCTQYIKSPFTERYDYYQNEIVLEYSQMQVNQILEEIQVRYDFSNEFIL